jgi:proteasome lid subunit RPN8/RPN11
MIGDGDVRSTVYKKSGGLTEAERRVGNRVSRMIGRARRKFGDFVLVHHHPHLPPLPSTIDSEKNVSEVASCPCGA